MRNRFHNFIWILGAVGLLAGCGPDSPRLIVHGAKGNTEVRVEVAKTDQQKTQGLMGRARLKDGNGMLFIYAAGDHPVMWMKGMLIPLDFVFIGEDGIINHIKKNILPCTEPNANECPRYGSEQASAYVLELPAGYTERRGIAEGDKVELQGFGGF